MSKIDEIIEHLKSFQGENRFGDEYYFKDEVDDILEQLRPYVELGELMFNLYNKDDIIIETGRSDFNKIHKFWEQIKEQENEQTN